MAITEVKINGKTEKIHTVYDLDYIALVKLIRENSVSYKRQYMKESIEYFNTFMTFDIESTSVNNVDKPYGFMYIWQACIAENIVVMGRTWEEFLILLENISKPFEHNCTRMVVYVHFLPFEFQFIRNFIEISELFALDKRKVVKFLANDFFEFRCSWKLSNMNLKKFTEHTQYPKMDGEEFNYAEFRTPFTELSNDEIAYAYCDVRGLYQAISRLIEDSVYNIATLPLTSTGFLRKEVKKQIHSNQRNRYILRNTSLSADQYQLCKLALRGGNAHANPMMSNTNVCEETGYGRISSKDMSSAYPAVIMQEKFPVTPLVRVLNTPDELVNIGKAFLAIITFKNFCIKTLSTIPYVASAKRISIKGGRYDNGRVLSATEITLALTDIDYQLIKSQYNYDSVESFDIFAANYDYLPDEYRSYVFERYIKKCNLNGKDEYLYAKEKNKINGLFGMMLTDIVHDEIIYSPDSDTPFVKQKADIEEQIEKWYSGRSIFLAYQWGLWVTAYCRQRLQKAIDGLGPDIIYCDTDSAKYIGEHEELFQDLNKEILEKTAKCGFNTEYTRKDGKHFSLGLWENDKNTPYKAFKTLGSKKYCYIDSKDEFHITVAGLSKIQGARYILTHAHSSPLELFTIGTVVPPGESGRTTAHYDDRTCPYKLVVKDPTLKKNVTFTTASSIAIENVAYTFGITDEYAELLEDLDKPLT